MFLNILRKNEYFIVFKIEQTASTDKTLLKWIKRYFWFRNKNVSYYEPYTNKFTLQGYVVAGTPNKPSAMKRTSLIFLLEMFAHLESATPISKEFILTEKTINNIPVQIYKIPKRI